MSIKKLITVLCVIIFNFTPKYVNACRHFEFYYCTTCYKMNCVAECFPNLYQQQTFQPLYVPASTLPQNETFEPNTHPNLGRPNVEVDTMDVDEIVITENEERNNPRNSQLKRKNYQTQELYTQKHSNSKRRVLPPKGYDEEN